ncbi:MAG: type 4a pilus biogenesis protein PilO [Planctomycetes bacterium]|nr:type 4a pilus biogenesis protein PilO [Planctomycetota bacterium]
MAANNQNKQMMIICGVGAAICALAIGGGFYAESQIDEIDVSIESQRQAIAAAKAKIVKIPNVEKDVVILRENLDEYVKILPDNADLPNFVRMLQQFETQSGGNSTLLQIKNSNARRGKQRFELIEYTYEMTATLWEMLRFVNLIENYERFVNISEFSISTGAKSGGADDNTRDGDAIHTIKLTMQTYTYNGKSSTKDVAIPKYDELRESLREEIFKRMQAIRIEKYEHKGQNGRRDVFVDPRIRGDEGVDGCSPSEQRAILERYIGEAERLRDMLRRVRREETTLFEQYALEKGLREGLAQLAQKMELDADKITYAPFRVRWAKEVSNALDDIRSDFERAAEDRPSDPYLPMPELQSLVAEMRQQCQSGYLEEARQRYETVAPQLQVPAEDERYSLTVEAKALHTKAVTALDFRQMDIRIQGVVVDREGRSGVLLNGEVYEEGEYVSEELLVKMVEEEQVWFVFRGLTLVRTM